MVCMGNLLWDKKDVFTLLENSWEKDAEKNIWT
jgi:hypothetical protein